MPQANKHECGRAALGDVRRWVWGMGRWYCIDESKEPPIDPFVE